MPVACQCKYAGVVLSCGGSGAGHLAHMRKKVLSKTGKLVAWGRINGVSAGELARLWPLHVELSVVLGMGLFWFPESGDRMLERIQRKGGRMILGYASRCPSPAILMELGWVGWQEGGVAIKSQLLRRLLSNPNEIVQVVVSASANVDEGWVARTADLLKGWCVGGLPLKLGEWNGHSY